MVGYILQNNETQVPGALYLVTPSECTEEDPLSCNEFYDMQKF